MNYARFIILFGLMFSAAIVLAAENVLFPTNLKFGDQSGTVLLLQKVLNQDTETRIAATGPGSLGAETEYFGSLTRNAVMKFQRKYRQDVLYPAGLYEPTGFVGVLTRRKLNALIVEAQNKPKATVSTNPAIPGPVVLSTAPDRVRKGDTIAVTGQNFTPTNNTVVLGDGPIEHRFSGLSSPDGKTITFVYEPPVIKTMTKEQIESLPPEYLAQIKKPIEAVGHTLDDAMKPFEGIHNEEELRATLERHGHSIEELYHHFWVSVENDQGKGMSKAPLVYGLRNLPYDTGVAETPFDMFFSKVRDFISGLLAEAQPVANAQSYGGGITTGVVMVCTCSYSLLTFQVDYALGGGTGLYVFQTGFVPNAGTGLLPGFWLGYYEVGAGTCSIIIPNYPAFCITIQGNLPLNSIGYSL